MICGSSMFNKPSKKSHDVSVLDTYTNAVAGMSTRQTSRLFVILNTPSHNTLVDPTIDGNNLRIEGDCDLGCAGLSISDLDMNTRFAVFAVVTSSPADFRRLMITPQPLRFWYDMCMRNSRFSLLCLVAIKSTGKLVRMPAVGFLSLIFPTYYLCVSRLL